MLIGIDASRAFRAQRTGTERYALEIIHHLLALPQATVHRWRLYTDTILSADRPIHFGTVSQQKKSREGGWPRSLPAHAEIAHLPGSPIWTHRFLGASIRQNPPDVLFIPAHVLPLMLPGLLPPSVVTVHDLGYRHYPGSRSRLERWHLDWSTKWSCYVANHVIAISQSTASDLHRFYEVPKEKMSVIHEGLPIQVSGGPKSNNRRFDLPRPYGLFVGTLQPRKNLLRLLQAYAQLCKSERPEWDLVLVGAKGWLSAEIESMAAELTDAVHMLGYVDDSIMPALFKGARFFAFPSLFEGFGLPILEANHYGVPVMTANNSSLPEVAGDAALLVDPLNVDEIASAMLRLSEDEALRQKLIAAGYENVKRFSWEKAAQETLAVLEKVASQKGR
ncbi:MAG: glycosyltransferase family 1 protein [Chloroflexota bacterium]